MYAHINEGLDFTASAMIVSPTRRVLLHNHKKLNRWLQIGGHVDLGEDYLEALRHELSEEAGLDIAKLELIDLSHPQRPNKTYDHPSIRSIPIPLDINRHEITPGHDHVDSMFLFYAPEEFVLNPADGESTRLAWFSESEIEELDMYEIIRDLAKAAISIVAEMKGF